MIALFRFFYALEIRVKLVLGRERAAVDTGEHFIFLRAAPVSARNGGELVSLYRRRAHHMRTRAQVGKISLLVERDRLSLVRMLFAKLDLVRLALLLKVLYSFVWRHRERFKLDTLLDDLLHFGFYFGKSFGGRRLTGVEIVVKAVVDSGTYRQFCRGEQALYSLCQYVRGGMVERAFALLVLKCEQIQRAVPVKASSHIADLAVDLRRTGSLGKP